MTHIETEPNKKIFSGRLAQMTQTKKGLIISAHLRKSAAKISFLRVSAVRFLQQ